MGVTGEGLGLAAGGWGGLGAAKRKEIVVLWFMKAWKMEQPCLPAVMTVIVSKWLPAGERSSEFCPGQRWTV